uniref:Protein MON2 homolog n=1 Tax=Schistocephalus solidus TaxID=70667 RepID=A0A0X3PWG4_SCHSO
MPETMNMLQLVEQIQQDLRSVVNETKRKYIPIKDSAETQMKCLTELINGRNEIRTYVLEHNDELAYPFLNGCSTKQPKLVSICLSALQRLITNNILTEETATHLVDTLQLLTESDVEELKVLQTIILLITTSTFVTEVPLANALAICFKLHSGKTSAIVNTAAAAVRQCTSAVFDRIARVGAERVLEENTQGKSKDDVFTFTPASKAAFFLFQDICQLTSGDIPHWMTNLDSISRLLGLELIESILINYHSIFAKEKEFTYLLKERVCPLVIKLLSPTLPSDLAHAKSTASSVGDSAGGSIAGASISASEFSINVRLYRIILLLCSKYFNYLNTECEVFLSSINRIIEGDYTSWRKALAMEVFFKVISQPDLLQQLCTSFDMLEPPSCVFRELIGCTSNYVQTTLRNQMSPVSAARDSATAGPNATAQAVLQRPTFIYRGSSFHIADVQKFSLSDMLDRSEVPALPEGYCLRLAISCVLQVVWSLQLIIDSSVNGTKLPTEDEEKRSQIHRQLMELSWFSLQPAISILNEACCDEKLNASFLQAEVVMIVLSSRCGLEDARSSFVAAICKASLPSNHPLSFQSAGDKTHSRPLITSGSSQTTDEALERSPVVVVVNATHGPGGFSSSLEPATQPDTSNVVQGSTTTSSASNADNTSLSPSPSLTPSEGFSKQHTSLFITAKHIQAARALLSLAQDSGAILETSWSPILATFQQLAWMLSLKCAPSQGLIHCPTANKDSGEAISVDLGIMTLNTSAFESATPPSVGSLTSLGSAASSVTSMAISKVINEIPTLSLLLSDVFEKSMSFDQRSLAYLVDALCKLATGASEAIAAGKEPSHFAVAKLTEVGLANIHRLELWWTKITSKILSMCKLTHLEMRKLSVDALVLLIKQAIMLPRKTIFWDDDAITTLVLDPLSHLTGVGFNDVQEKQLQCVQYLLHCYGERINGCWLRLINIICAISQSQSDQLIRTAFQCFQLVVTDYLSTLRFECYPACVQTASKFGHQSVDLNIALSAIGSLLHLADFLFQREAGSDEASKIEALWVEVFCCLSDLCQDRRPAVRKSAGQTLFNAVECHSSQFVDSTWCDLLWTVFFPLLTKVQEHCANAPAEREGRTTTLLLHHTRDTAAKQWAETVVLTLSGVARCFVSKQEQLVLLERFSEAWNALLSNIERAVLMPNAEIAHNALQTLGILLSFDAASLESRSDPQRASDIWLSFWRTWLSIGHNFVFSFVAASSASTNGVGTTTSATNSGIPSTSDRVTSNGPLVADTATAQPVKCSMRIPDGPFFTLYFELFKALFPRIRGSFNLDFFAEFRGIIEQGVLGPLYAANGSAQQLSTHFSTVCSTSLVDDSGLTPTQKAVYDILVLFSNEMQNGLSNIQGFLVPYIEMLLRLSLYAVYIPRPGSSALSSSSTSLFGQVEAIPVNYIVFGEKCMELATELFKIFANYEALLEANVMQKMIEALRIPLAAKYRCQCQSTWLLASRCFIDVITVGVPIATRCSPSTRAATKPRRSSATELDVWNVIYSTLRDFLFCPHHPVEALSGEEFQLHEALDCKFVSLICDQFLSNPSDLPLKFIEQLVGLLGLGSIQASVSNGGTYDSTILTLPGPERRLPSVHRSARLSLHGDGGGGVELISRCPDAVVRGVGHMSASDDLRPFSCREAFMKLCFESLLRFAFFNGVSLPAENKKPFDKFLRSSNEEPSAHVMLCRLAVRDVIQRCTFILQQFSRAVQFTGKCPLPRANLSEVNFVFQALTLTLTNFMAASPTDSIDTTTWQTVIDLYPLIVDCVFVSDNSRVFPGLRQLLRLYGSLLQPRLPSAPGTPTVINQGRKDSSPQTF